MSASFVYLVLVCCIILMHWANFAAVRCFFYWMQLWIESLRHRLVHLAFNFFFFFFFFYVLYNFARIVLKTDSSLLRSRIVRHRYLWILSHPFLNFYCIGIEGQPALCIIGRCSPTLRFINLKLLLSRIVSLHGLILLFRAAVDLAEVAEALQLVFGAT